MLAKGLPRSLAAAATLLTRHPPPAPPPPLALHDAWAAWGLAADLANETAYLDGAGPLPAIPTAPGSCSWGASNSFDCEPLWKIFPGPG